MTSVAPAKRRYGTGQLHEKHGSCYGRWRTSDGRKLNRRIGAIRSEGIADGLTRAQAERAFRRLQDTEEKRPSAAAGAERRTVGQAADSLRRKLALEGARRSYLDGCESMQRVHVAPTLGEKPLESVTTAQVEGLAAAIVESGRSSKTTRNVLTFLHSVFEHAIDRGWCRENPVRRRPGRGAGAAPTRTRICSFFRSLSSKRSSARSPMER